jgi:putative ABC transport system permease protein
MFKNFFLSAWRNLLKGKLYSVINIFGLAIGMAVTLLIACWISDEITFDSYHSNHSHIAQVMDVYGAEGEKETDLYIAIPVANELRTHYPTEFRKVVLASGNRDHILAAGDKKIERRGLWAEPDFPEIFSFKMENG